MAPPVPLSAATPDLTPIAPDEAGFAPDLEARLDKLIADKRAWNLHGVVVVRGGRLVLELQLVLTITAGNYGAGDQWIPPTGVLREVVLASVV